MKKKYPEINEKQMDDLHEDYSEAKSPQVEIVDKIVKTLDEIKSDDGKS